MLDISFGLTKMVVPMDGILTLVNRFEGIGKVGLRGNDGSSSESRGLLQKSPLDILLRQQMLIHI